MTIETATIPVTLEGRKELTARAVRSAVSQGGRIESQSDCYAVIAKGHRPNHVLHLILTLVTFGLWAPVWAAVAIFGGEQRRAVSVDEYGNVLVEKL